MSKTYLTQNNCFRTYEITIEKDNKVVVKKIKYPGDYEEIYKTKANEIFIGKSPLNSMTVFSGGYGEHFDGNSVLLNIKNLDYVYIGDCIISFVSDAKITEYLSPVGNKYIHYPYARDINGKYYLMLDKVSFKIDIIEDPYDYYHEVIEMTQRENSFNRYDSGILKYLINGKSNVLNLPSYINPKVTKNSQIINKSGQKIDLTQDIFEKYVEDYRNKTGIRPYHHSVIDNGC